MYSGGFGLNGHLFFAVRVFPCETFFRLILFGEFSFGLDIIITGLQVSYCSSLNRKTCIFFETMTFCRNLTNMFNQAKIIHYNVFSCIFHFSEAVTGAIYLRMFKDFL